MNIEKQTKQPRRTEEQKQNHGFGKHFDGCHVGEGCGAMGEEVKGLRSTNR